MSFFVRAAGGVHPHAEASATVVAADAAEVVQLESSRVSFVAPGSLTAGRYGLFRFEGPRLPPLAAMLFFAYAERGAPWRRAYVALAAVLGLGAWAIPFGSLADSHFSFDSPTLSAYGTLVQWMGHANASTVFAGGALLAAVVIGLIRTRVRTAPYVALAAAVPLLFLTTVAYVGDHGMTERASSALHPASWSPTRAGARSSISMTKSPLWGSAAPKCTVGTRMPAADPTSR